ncbi:MAG: EamA family transporter [Chloroflexota bacterium]
MKKKIWIALLLVYFVWGSTYLGIRFAVETIPPFLHAGVRFLIAGTILFPWRRLAGDPAPTRNQWKSAIIIGVLLIVCGNGLIALAETNLPSGIAALLVATTPMFMVIIEALRPGGSKPTLIQVLALLIGFGGVALLIGPAEFGGTREFSLVSGGIVIAAAILWSIGSIYNRHADLPESSLLFSGMEMLMGSIGLIILSLFKGEWIGFQIADVSTRSIFGLIYLILIGSLVGFTSYAWLLRNAPISLLSTYPYVNPIVAVLLGALFAQEKITPRLITSAIIIVGSIILVNLSNKKNNQLSEQNT